MQKTFGKPLMIMLCGKRPFHIRGLIIRIFIRSWVFPWLFCMPLKDAHQRALSYLEREPIMKINLKQYVLLLRKYLVEEKWGLFSLFLVLLLNVLVETAKPTILGQFIDQVSTDIPMARIYGLAIFFLVLTAARQGIAVIVAWLTQNIGWRATNGLRIDLTAHTMDLDMSFHKRFTPGQLVERVDGDINSLFGFFTTFITGIVLNMLMMIGVFIYFFIIDWRFALIYIIATGLVYLYMPLMGKRIDRASEGLREEESNLYGIVGEAITSVEDIRTLNARTHTLNRMNEVLKRLFGWWKKDYRYGFGSWAYDEAILWSAEFIIILVMAAMVLRGDLTIGTAYLINRLGELIINPILSLREELMYMQKTDASIRRIRELLDEKRSLSEGSRTKSEGRGGLALEGVSFSYEDGEKVIDDVSFQLGQGRVLGLLGRTGSGKTTLARLIVKLYDPEKGSVLIDGTDAKVLSDASLRDKISYVTQEVQLFNSSVRDNLTLYDDRISDEKIMATIDRIGIMDWFRKLPEGLDTKISVEAPFLSTGELQLLTFVRVFLKEPEIVILDEATSRLDPITEKYLEQALNSLLEGRTAIIIAHRLKTVLRADEIMILEDGRILEKGPTGKLSQDPGSHFAELLQRGMEEVLI